MKGPTSGDQPGVPGILGVPDAANYPYPRSKSVSWTGADESLWLFGGIGFSATEGGHLNDLWNYDVETGNWTWMKGSSLSRQPGVYGTLGLPETPNNPGSRYDATSWVDAEGAFWVFGGGGYDSVGVYDYPLNDLWRGGIIVNKNAVNVWLLYQ